MAHRQYPETPQLKGDGDKGISKDAVAAAEESLQDALDAFHNVGKSSSSSLVSPDEVPGVVTTSSIIKLPKDPDTISMVFRLRDCRLEQYWKILSLLTVHVGYYIRCEKAGIEIPWYSSEAIDAGVTYTLKDYLLLMHGVTPLELQIKELQTTDSKYKRKQILETLVVRNVGKKTSKQRPTPFVLQEINWLNYANEKDNVYTFSKRIVVTHGLDIPLIAEYYRGELLSPYKIRIENPFVEMDPADRHFRIYIEGRKSQMVTLWPYFASAMEPLSLMSTGVIYMSSQRMISTMDIRDMLFRMYYESFGFKTESYSRFCAVMQSCMGYATNADFARIAAGRSMGGTISPVLGAASMLINSVLAGNISRPSDVFFLMSSGVPDL